MAAQIPLQQQPSISGSTAVPSSTSPVRASGPKPSASPGMANQQQAQADKASFQKLSTLSNGSTPAPSGQGDQSSQASEPQQGNASEPQDGKQSNPFNLPPSVVSPDHIRQSSLADRQQQIEEQVIHNIETGMGGVGMFPTESH